MFVLLNMLPACVRGHVRTHPYIYKFAAFSSYKTERRGEMEMLETQPGRSEEEATARLHERHSLDKGGGRYRGPQAGYIDDTDFWG